MLQKIWLRLAPKSPQPNVSLISLRSLSILWPKTAAKLRSHARNFYLDNVRHFKRPGWAGPARIRFALKKEAKNLYPDNLKIHFPAWPLSQMDELRALILREFPDHAQAIERQAERYLAGEYQILEAQPRNLKHSAIELAGKFQAEPAILPWHYDWIHPYRWDPRQTYLNCPFNEFDGIDVKLPWELSRFHHLTTLAQAACLTGAGRFVKEIVLQLEDWRRNNPPGYGVNWACTMDVAIRAANVLFAVGLLENELERHPDECKRLRAILPAFVFNHALHIAKNLEASGNHRLADLAGLALLAEFYPHFYASDEWGDSAFMEMKRQMAVQIYPDGMDFESSTSYHRLVTEFFLFCFLIWRNKGRLIPDGFVKKLQQMIKAIGVYTKTNNEAVQFGDNDSGRFLVMAPERAILDHSYLTCVGALALQKPTLQNSPESPRPVKRGEDKGEGSPYQTPHPALSPLAQGEGFRPEALWLLGPDSWQAWKSMILKAKEKNSASQERFQYQELPDGGIYAARNRVSGHFLAVSLSANGQAGNGGHAHNDRLGFHLMLYGEDIFVDPGTGVYLRDRALRDEFRSTAGHNTLILGGEEQNRMDAGPFCLRLDVKHPKKISSRLDKTSGAFAFAGEHDGYARLKPPVAHRRSFHAELGSPKFSLEITDEIVPAPHPIPPPQGRPRHLALPPSPKLVTSLWDSKRPRPPEWGCGAGGRAVQQAVPCGRHGAGWGAVWNFILAPGVSVSRCSGGSVEIETPGNKKYALETLMPMETAGGKYSPQFGVIVPTQRIKCRMEISVPSTHKFVFKEL
ncbi:MAG: alginate lyase family protein [Elusimicrobia bacterium]|nr:alginate lyase family protein [Elusimicrobiota bacterium]